MKRLMALAILLLVSKFAFPQGKPKGERDFKYPVLVKLIEGNGNIFRIGFLRYNDYYGIEENANDPKNIYANFIDLADVSKGGFKDKCFVYFPLSKGGGEMLIVSRSDVSKLDMTYKQAMDLIVVNGNE